MFTVLSHSIFGIFGAEKETLQQNPNMGKTSVECKMMAITFICMGTGFKCSMNDYLTHWYDSAEILSRNILLAFEMSKVKVSLVAEPWTLFGVLSMTTVLDSGSLMCSWHLLQNYVQCFQNSNNTFLT